MRRRAVKRKYFTVVQVAVLVVMSTLAGATAGRGIPSLPGTCSIPPAKANSLDVKPLAPLVASGNGFTYQGRLVQGGAPATGQYDLRFTLYDDPSAGSQVGTPVEVLTQTVTNGLFAITLDFGASAFDGNAR